MRRESHPYSDQQSCPSAPCQPGVAGLAIETEHRLPSVPVEMVEDAERLGLPPYRAAQGRSVCRSHRGGRLVAVTEAINDLLVNESVRRLQLADRVSHALAAALAAGG